MECRLKQLTVCHVNIRGLNDHKLSAIKANLLDQYDIITLSETFLSNNSCIDLSIPGFHDIIRKDRASFGGGVAVYVKNNLSYTRAIEYECYGIECIWLKLITCDGTILMCTVYRPPSNRQFWEHFEASIDLVKSASSTKHLLILGDINADPCTPDGNRLHELCVNYNLTCHIDVPTRITQTSQSCLDQIITNMPNFVRETNVHPPLSNNDHCTVSVKLSFKLTKDEPYYRHIWLYDKGDFDGLRDSIAHYDWDVCFASNNVNTMCEMWTDTLLNLARTFIPNKMVLVRPNDKPWYTNELRLLKRKIDRLYKSLRATLSVDSNEKWQMYYSLRNTYKMKIKEAVNEYNERFNVGLGDSSINDKKWWTTVNKLLGKSKDDSVPPMYDSVTDSHITKSIDKAEYFNKYFLSHNRIDASNSELPEFTHVGSDVHVLEIIQVTEEEVLDQIKALKIGKATGPDNISAKILKEAGLTIVPSLTRLINICLSTSIVPDMWKKAHVIPIHKQGDRHIFSNYRPISLLSVVSKILEKVVFKHVYNYFYATDLLSSHQSGFRPGDSTVNQLAYLYHTFCQAIDAKKDIKIVFCDVSKAFDKVWHKGLLYKLHKTGVRGRLLSWFENYLSQRLQRVVIKGQHSSWGGIEAGVPQGSVLGPLLFLVYINDLVDEVDCAIKLFADDTTLYVTFDDQDACAVSLNTNLTKIKKWADTWLVNFNPTKTECMTISLKRNVVKIPVCYDNKPLTDVNQHKHLGVTFNNKLTWNDHIQSLLLRISKLKDVMFYLKNKLARSTLEHIYKSFVRPKLEYASIVWADCSESNKMLLERCQSAFARVVTGARKGTSSVLLYKEVNWPSLEDRRRESILIFMHKLFYGNCPEYLGSLLPEHNVTSQYNLRQSHSIPHVMARTEKYRKSLIPMGVRLWNNLPLNIQSLEDLGEFKKAICTTSSKNTLYNIGLRKFQIIHAQLRMGCSTLSSHLFDIHVKDSPNCFTCNVKEDCEHFFLYCNLYRSARRHLSDVVNKHGSFNIQTLLYGDPCKCFEDNVKIFEAVHNFIHESGRFYM